MSANQRIGIIGGSFNPVHSAHLIIAEQFREQNGLDRLFFVPAYMSPFKPGGDFYAGATPRQRCDMVELAIAGNPFFAVEDFEIRRQEISYTIDTVNFFREKFPHAELFLLIGTDQARDFQKWKHWQEILMKVQLCIARRPGYLSEAEEEGLLSLLRVGERLPCWVDAPLLEISATEIRKKIAEGKSVRYLVPDTVERFIAEKNIYRTAV